MNQEASAAEQPAPNWRLRTGVGVFLLSVILPVAGLVALPRLGLSGAMTATVSGALLLVAEALGVVGVAIMGKPGYLYIKRRGLRFPEAVRSPQGGQSAPLQHFGRKKRGLYYISASLPQQPLTDRPRARTFSAKAYVCSSVL